MTEQNDRSDPLANLPPDLRSEVERLMALGIPRRIARQQAVLQQRGWYDIDPATFGSTRDTGGGTKQPGE